MSRTRVVYLLYAVSGALSLGYQVIWFRVFADRFGATSLTFLVVLTGFIAGLGAGALLSRPLTDWLMRRAVGRDGLRCYGLIELAIAAAVGLTGILALVPVEYWAGVEPYRLIDGIYRRGLGYRATEIGVAFTCVVVPSVLMGLTYPLLCRTFPGETKFPSALYAANTLGAAAGVLAAQLLALRHLGHVHTLWLLVGMNALIGAYFLRAGGAPFPRPARRSGAARPVVAPPPGSSLTAVAMLAGFLTGAIEGDLIKRIWFLGATTTAAMAFVSFWAILAIFAGAAIVRGTGIGLGQAKLAAAGAVAYYALIWQVVYPARRALELRYAESIPEVPRELAHFLAANAVDANPLFALLVAGIFVFPVLLAFSLLLPLCCNVAHAGGRAVGGLYGANTLSFCLGLFAFSWLAPRVSIFYSLKLLPWVAGIGVAYLLALSFKRAPGARAGVLAAAALAGAAWLTPAAFDRDLLDPYRRAYHFPARAMKSNGASTTYVIEDPEGDRLYFDGRPMSGTSVAAQTYMRVMAHFPLLAQSAPRRALVIGFGVGNTAAGVARHREIERIDIAELNHRVYETAPEFRAANEAVYDDPRVRLHHEDGRALLALSEGPYDLITCEPPPPIQDGIHRLFSTEYYRSALGKLSPDGVVSQWLPVSQIPGEAIARMLATFTAAFPHSLLLVGHGRELVMVGSRAPLDLSRVAARYAALPGVRADLARFGIRSAQQLLSRVVAGGDTLRAAYAGHRIISDARNDLAFLRFEPGRPLRIAYRGAEIFAPYADGRGLFHHLQAVARAPGRIQYRVPDFPFDLVRFPGLSPAAGERLRRLPELGAGYARARRAGSVAEARALIEAVLDADPDQPWWLWQRAELALAGGRAGEAVAALRHLAALEPDAPEVALRLARALVAAGRFEEALAEAGRALAGAPTPEGLVLQARALSGLRRFGEALDSYRRALVLDPRFLPALRGQAKLISTLQKRVR